MARIVSYFRSRMLRWASPFPLKKGKYTWQSPKYTNVYEIGIYVT